MKAKILFGALAGGALVLVFFQTTRVGESPDDDPVVTSPASVPPPSSGGVPPSAVVTKRVREEDSGQAKRKHQLEDLLARWEHSEPADNPKAESPQRQALVKEAAETLLCSQELVAFIMALDDKGYPSHREKVNQVIAGLLRGGRAGEVRHSLVSLVESNGDPYTPTDNIFRQWVKEAGVTATAAELEAFLNALSTDRSRLDALGAFNGELAKTKPSEAVTSTLEKLVAWEWSGSIENSLQDQVRNLPPGTDFATIEGKVPPQAGQNPRRDEMLDSMRSLIFQKWAESDPAGAANHIMANPGRIPEKYLATIAQQVCNRNINGALQWVQTFPEGRYYDVAVGGIVIQLSQVYPAEAAELAGRIGDDEMRDKRIAELKRIGVIK